MTVVVYDGGDVRDSLWSYYKSEIRRRQLLMPQLGDVLPQNMGKGHGWSKCSPIKIHEACQTKANTSFKVVRQRTEVDAICFVAPLIGGGVAYEPCYLRSWLPAQF
jgi:hypothetical protein